MKQIIKADKTQSMLSQSVHLLGEFHTGKKAVFIRRFSALIPVNSSFYLQSLYFPLYH